MVKLTRLKGQGDELILNSDLIEYVEATPDTVITLVNGHKFVVQESTDEVVQRIIDFKRQIFGRALR